jgi:ribosomal protein S5
MIMMEEFRRRKNLNDYYDLMKINQQRGAAAGKQDELGPFDMSKASQEQAHQFHGSNAERYFEPKRDEVFNPNHFTLIFMASDSVTNVTSLNRVNSRRVLIFVGNGNGLVSYGKGKAEEYEQAFDNAFKKAR